MKLALECPTKYLSHIQPFTDYDFMLAHKVLKEPDYAKWYKESGNKVKIMDNSVNELGEPLTIEDLKKAVELTGSTMVVAPDHIGDSYTTVKSYIETRKAFEGMAVIPVVQGEGSEEILECVKTYLELGDLPIMAIPYDIGSKKTDQPMLMGLRRALVVLSIPIEVPIHLLGFTSLEEFVWYKSRSNVVSIDTGVPVLQGLRGLDIADELDNKAKPTQEIMDTLEMNQSTWTAVIRNIALLRKEINW